ncbi:dihydrofolate reductase family protein [Embleya sp. NBC_00896]|uniref:dihydrofolate reductase family protein n=1 Tax=Embleya sp. NBC_00896 TaxID=2975961 RepID=UPI002F9175D4
MRLPVCHQRQDLAHRAMWENTTRIPGTEAIATIRKMREADGRDLAVTGSAALVGSLLREDLVDELRLIVMPVILGGGKTVFPDDGRLRTLKLTSTVVSDGGVHVCTYQPADQG